MPVHGQRCALVVRSFLRSFGPVSLVVKWIARLMSNIGDVGVVCVGGLVGVPTKRFLFRNLDGLNRNFIFVQRSFWLWLDLIERVGGHREL